MGGTIVKKIKQSAMIVMAAMLFVFVIQNWESVPINYLVWSFETPRALLTALLFSGGFVGGYCYRLWTDDG